MADKQDKSAIIVFMMLAIGWNLYLAIEGLGTQAFGDGINYKLWEIGAGSGAGFWLTYSSNLVLGGLALFYLIKPKPIGFTLGLVSLGTTLANEIFTAMVIIANPAVLKEQITAEAQARAMDPQATEMMVRIMTSDIAIISITAIAVAPPVTGIILYLVKKSYFQTES